MSDPALQDAIAALWSKYEGLTRERLAEVDRALIAAELGNLSDALRSSAAAEAHKLAGSLGTFGMDEASEAANQIESELSEGRLDPAAVKHMRELFEVMREAIATRP